MYDNVFITVWTLVLSVVLVIFGLERFGISAEYTIRNRSLINFSTPPLATFGNDSAMFESSKKGRIADAGFPMMTLELINPVPFTKVLVKGVTEGYVKDLEIQGVGFKANLKGKQLDLALGYSHPI
ncbi:MAG: hypothetical protein RLZ17_914, partial [Actinomycetota bacterium]